MCAWRAWFLFYVCPFLVGGWCAELTTGAQLELDSDTGEQIGFSMGG